MLLKCTADGRRIKVNSSALPGNVTGARASGMKMTMSATPTMTSRVHRKVMRAPHKRAHPGKLQHYPGKMALLGGKPHLVSKYGSSKLAHYARLYSGKPHASRGKLLPPHAQPSRLPDPCDNSNDSGLGPDRDPARFSDAANSEWSAVAPSAAAAAAVGTGAEAKRRRMEIKYESDDANDNYSFPELQRLPPPPPLAPQPAHSALSNSRADCSSIPSPAMSQSPGKLFGSAYRSHGKLASAGKMASKLSSSAGKFGSGKIASSGKLANALARRRALATSTQTGPPTLSAHLPSVSRDGRVQLQIVCQPETQHRARYQTEGSRGAVKDNSGNGFPIVKLVGYDKPAVLEVFIGTDTGRVAPHMFYQACRVSGKNSTPCKERKEDGTVLIEIELDPAKNWQVTCDCVGILKERNVDVEHRFGEAGSGVSGAGGAGGAVSRGKKKSTRCRMVFRTQVLNPDGTSETLQVSSSQIICTQPPGVPEISLKSLASCPASGGFNLVLLGKNFLKDTRVVLLHAQDSHTLWEEHVVPYKDFLTQTHVACCVPAYARTDIAEPVPVQLYVLSGGKASESHSFYYTPLETSPQPTPCTSCARHAGGCSDEARPVMLWGSGAAGGGGMMPPPALPPRRPSLILPDPHSPLGLKSELHDESSQHSLLDHSETSNMSFVNENSCDAHVAHSDVSGDHTSNSSDALLRSRLVALGAPSSQLLMSDEMKVVDLRLKSESMEYARYAPTIKLSPPSSEPPEPDASPLASFARQLQAIHTQVQTDKMVESVTAALFQENAARIYADPPILIEDNFNADIKAINSDLLMRDAPMKTMNPELMMRDASMPPPPPLAPPGDPAPDSRLLGFVPYGAVQDSARSLSEQTAQMEALVDDAMQTSGEMLPSDAAKLEALVNSTVENHMCSESLAASASASHATDVMMSPPTGAAVASGDMRPPLPSSASISPDVILNPGVSPSLLTPMMQAPPASQDELMLMSEPMQMPTAVKTPPAAVKSMILNAAAEILTSDSAMNALVTSAINTANILTTESASAATAMTCAQSSPQPADGLQSESSPEAPMSAMSQAVSQAVTQAVSQAVSHAVSQAVSQEMTAPVQGLTDMSDSDLLSYINPSAFDQV